MKTRESGMPDEAQWASFFSPEVTLARLGLTSASGDVVDFGCGYGTFTVAAARITTGLVHALDIEPAMLEAARRQLARAGLTNVRFTPRDFTAAGTGLADRSVGYVMLFNILHCEEPWVLLDEAMRVLRPGGLLAIMHWRYDAATPRGPSMGIRPRPGQCRAWAERAGFILVGPAEVDLPPHHYGLVLAKPDS